MAGVDKSCDIDDVIPVLRTFRAPMWVICTLAFLVMPGVQSLHACVDGMGGIEHAEPSSCPDEQDCSSEHCCCQPHFCMTSIVPELLGALFPPTPSCSNVVGDEACGEGPCREIDYPPQLS